MKAVHFGIRQRLSPALESAFFDPEMPAEWRVAFLLNEQDALWVGRDDDDVDTVLAELADAPSPVVVVVDETQWGPVWERLAQDGFHRVIRLQDDTAIWRPGQEGAGRAAAVGLVPASADPGQLSAWLKAFVGQCPEQGALFVDGEPPSMATVERLQTLAELMGT